jgi:pyocin large subunit-like protein
MRYRIFSLLTILAVIFTVTGCGRAKDTKDESLYDLIIEDSSSSVSKMNSEDSVSAVESSAESILVEASSAEVETAALAGTEVSEESNIENGEYTEYWFRTKKQRDQHYEKHGIEMGFASADDYRKAASDVVNDPTALHKTEKEDGDDVYYIEATNEFVVVSKDGYLRTYFNPDKGKDYYDRQ